MTTKTQTKIDKFCDELMNRGTLTGKTVAKKFKTNNPSYLYDSAVKRGLNISRVYDESNRVTYIYNGGTVTKEPPTGSGAASRKYTIEQLAELLLDIETIQQERDQYKSKWEAVRAAMEVN